MKKFKNVKTGNIVRAKTEAAAALMEKSAQYVALAEPKKGKNKDKDNADAES